MLDLYNNLGCVKLGIREYHTTHNDFFDYAVKQKKPAYLEFLMESAPLTNPDVLLAAFDGFEKNPKIVCQLTSHYFKSVPEEKRDQQKLLSITQLLLKPQMLSFNFQGDMANIIILNNPKIMQSLLPNLIEALFGVVQAGQKEQAELMLNILKESKEFNLDVPVQNKLLLCEALAVDIDLAHHLITKHHAQCNLAIAWLLSNERVDVLSGALKLPEFKNVLQDLLKVDDVKNNFLNKKSFVRVMLINGMKLDHPSFTQYAAIFERYQKIADELKGMKPIEQVMGLLQGKTELRMFSRSLLPSKIQRDESRVSEFIKEEIQNVISRSSITDESYLLKLLLLQNLLEVIPKEDLSVKRLQRR